MKFTINNSHATQATKFDLTAVCSDIKCALQRATPYVGPKPGWFEIALKGPSITAGIQVLPSFIKFILAGHTVTCNAEDMTGIVVESDSIHTKHKFAAAVENVLYVFIWHGKRDRARSDQSWCQDESQHQGSSQESHEPKYMLSTVADHEGCQVYFWRHIAGKLI